MTTNVDDRVGKWWSRPIAYLVFGCGLIAGVAGLITNSETIMGLFNQHGQTKIRLDVLKTTLSQDLNSMANKNGIESSVRLNKIGALPLRDCRFSAWFDKRVLTVIAPDKPFDIPSGQFGQTMFVTVALPSGLAPYDIYLINDGKLALICDNAGSEEIKLSLISK